MQQIESAKGLSLFAVAVGTQLGKEPDWASRREDALSGDGASIPHNESNAMRPSPTDLASLGTDGT